MKRFGDTYDSVRFSIFPEVRDFNKSCPTGVRDWNREWIFRISFPTSRSAAYTMLT